MEVVCPKCGYSWVTRSVRRFITCPNCYRKLRNPYWVATGTSTTSTGTTRSPPSEIAVWVVDVPEECYRDLKELAEEASSPDPLGVEVLVLDADVAREVLEYHGVRLE